jgi:hypothetical protein
MRVGIDPVPLVDREPLEWLGGHLAYGPTVASWLPASFEGYARILHPAHRAGAPVPWSEVARWSGNPLDRATSIQDLARRRDGTSWQRQGTSLPLEGQLEPPFFGRLLEILAEVTSTPERLWLLVWQGYAGGGAPYSRANHWSQRFARSTRRSAITGLPQGEPVEVSSSLTASGRTYFLHPGSIEGSPGEGDRGVLDKPPSFWWPNDRAWFVSTDIDSSSTYVGGSSALITRLLVDDLLEALTAALNDPYDGSRDARAGGTQ